MPGVSLLQILCRGRYDPSTPWRDRALGETGDPLACPYKAPGRESNKLRGVTLLALPVLLTWFGWDMGRFLWGCPLACGWPV